MLNLLSRLQQEFPFLGTRAARESDFYEYCESKGVTVVFTPDVRAGLYVMFACRHYIFLNTGLWGEGLLHVMFHELAHFIFHAPAQCGAEYFDGHRGHKNHEEAENTAALLMFPTVKSAIDCEIESGSMNKRLTELIDRRKQIFQRFAI